MENIMGCAMAQALCYIKSQASLCQICHGQMTQLQGFLRIKGKAIPLQAWTGPVFQEVEAPRFHNNRHMKVVSPRHQPPLAPRNNPGIQFCQRLSQHQGLSAAGRITLMKHINDTIGNRNRDLPVCSMVLNQLCHCVQLSQSTLVFSCQHNSTSTPYFYSTPTIHNRSK